MPSIREWTGGSGSFELRPPSRIVVDSGDLAGEAQLLRDDVAAVTGLELPVATGKNPHPGDLFLSTRGAPAGVGSVRTLPRGEARDWPRFRERGYLLDVSGAGVFYGTQTVLQMLRSTAGQR